MRSIEARIRAAELRIDMPNAGDDGPIVIRINGGAPGGTDHVTIIGDVRVIGGLPAPSNADPWTAREGGKPNETGH